ncbi:hypothetical protein [Salidesulfovibrio onnuriiensis]|uniref:hypothetical protein n=1 Tax=Salidesulfovibrio onnuriiensis TaxID=2583823 RepID=UPI0011CA00B4|nr:hypothetical protein [Salidesulfovibrio onnuriiensis]
MVELSSPYFIIPVTLGVLMTIAASLVLAFRAGSDPERQQWLRFAKFALGSFVLALVSIAVNHQIQLRSVELEEQKHLTTLIPHIVDKSPATRLELARFFSTVTVSPNIRSGWRDYYAKVQTEVEQAEQALAEKQRQEEKQAAELKARLSVPGEASPAKDPLTQGLYESLNATRTDIKMLREQLQVQQIAPIWKEQQAYEPFRYSYQPPERQ